MKPLLIIDDDPHFATMLARTLSRQQFSVAQAHNPDEVWTALAQQIPDFAVVDMKLAHSSGLDLISPLRQANAKMRIVVLTGYASIATTVEAIKRGADDYLTKPLEIDSLLNALQDTPQPLDGPPSCPMSLRRLEWEHIQRVLQEHNGNVSGAARAMGMHRRTLQRRLAKRPVAQ